MMLSIHRRGSNVCCTDGRSGFLSIDLLVPAGGTGCSKGQGHYIILYLLHVFHLHAVADSSQHCRLSFDAIRNVTVPSPNSSEDRKNITTTQQLLSQTVESSVEAQSSYSFPETDVRTCRFVVSSTFISVPFSTRIGFIFRLSRKMF
jgi:hypothetical protein